MADVTERHDALEAAKLWAKGEYTGLSDRVAADEFARLAVALERDIAIRPDSLATLYAIRKAMGFNEYYPLSNLAADARWYRNKVEQEREAIANRAREIAGQYSEGSDGRNTFILLAEWIEARS